MSLTIGDNFQFLGSKPLDARLKYNTVAAMKAMADSTLYDGCLAYCVATDKTYQWKSTNEVDADLGKWREFESGGGYSAGDGIDITNGEISTDNMPSDDMEEVASPLPGVMSRLPVLFDESGAERVVGWYKYANGTKKPVYEKTLSGTLPSSVTEISHQITNIDKLINAYANCYDNDAYIPDGFYNGSNRFSFFVNKTQIGFRYDNAYANKPYMITLQYTKTTDTAS